jgi:hypothetical protein
MRRESSSRAHMRRDVSYSSLGSLMIITDSTHDALSRLAESDSICRSHALPSTKAVELLCCCFIEMQPRPTRSYAHFS